MRTARTLKISPGALQIAKRKQVALFVRVVHGALRHDWRTWMSALREPIVWRVFDGG